MKKKTVVEAYIRTKEENIKGLQQALESIRQDVIDAPGSNVSHSDTSRFQHSNLALEHERRLIDAERSLGMFKAVPQASFTSIFVGSFFVLMNKKTGEQSFYLLIPEGGGDWFEADGIEVLSISEEGPLAQALRGKEKGDKVTFRDRTLEVVDVQ